jgi:CheY-like chemotaxis protein
MARATKVKKVLIVEDNKYMASCLRDMVEFFDVSSQAASDGDEAIQLLERSEYSLVIADSRMPKVSGFTLLKYIKRNYPHIPVAIISTRNSRMTQGLVVKDAPDFYLPKPVSSADIERVLSQI